MREGRVLVITGNGKGKTSSAIGTAIRASGQGFDVLFLQFIKKASSRYGEHKFFLDSDSSKFLIKPIGLGFKFGKEQYTDKDMEASRTWSIHLNNFIKLAYDPKKLLVVLDEVSYPILYSWIREDELVNCMNKYPSVNFILTGRDMPQKILDYADTVSSIEEIKHAYQDGRDASIGIEF